MIRACANCLRNTLRALIVLIVLPCVAEVGLRFFTLMQPESHQTSLESPLVEPSESTHHQLRPLQRIHSTNPDTNQPVEIVTNSLGLRGPEWEVPKPPGTLRIICLGDENVLGPEMMEDETFPARLQQLLQPVTKLNVEVINAGVPGYCPLLTYLQVRHRLLALQPDFFVLNFDMSDVAEDYRYRRHTMMGTSEKPLACSEFRRMATRTSESQRWTDQFLIAHYCQEYLGDLWQTEARKERDHDIGNTFARYAWLEQDAPDWSVHIQQTLSAIDDLRNLVEGTHARLIVATYPAPWQVSPLASNGLGVREQAGVPQNAVYTGNAPFQILTQWGQSRGLVVCDTSGAFRSIPQPERLYLKNAPRFSSLGNRLYAQQLAQCVVRWLPAPGRDVSPTAPLSLTRSRTSTTQ